ncbi:MAG TPA: DUF481 domain-containing protein [Candidatus Polarisedimenticolia bacterium]|nr:DUF481 domain-containing protein [Candidatus Polarisedimenticolia bacterium]
MRNHPNTVGRRLAAGPIVLAALCLSAWLPLRAEDPPPDRWRDSAEFSFVATGGNAETQALGFKNKLWRAWERSAFELNAGGVRAESTTITRTAEGTPNDFDVDEDSETSLTAENYFLNGRYDRKITDRFFWFGGAGWDRNRFNGVENRYTVIGGVGNIWYDTERLKFRTDYAATVTRQEDVIENPEVDDTFLGVRFSWAYLNKFGANTTYTNDLVLDDNLDETADFRANMINSVSVAMSARLALKVSLQALYDNRPSFVDVDLFDNLGASTGLTVPVELEELDTIFTASLVVNM